MTATGLVRPHWEGLELSVRAGIRELVGGRVVASRTPPGGHSPQLATRLTLADDRTVFVKATPDDGSDLAVSARREAGITAELPAGTAAPAVLATGEAAGWFVAVYADVSGRHPDLSPQSADLAAVLDVLARVAEQQPGQRLSGLLGGPGRADYLHGWAELRADQPPETDPWVADHLSALITLEGRRREVFAGAALCHSDGRVDNMLISRGSAVLVDWAHAHLGAGWQDTAFLVPQMVQAGWPPGEAIQAVANHPAATPMPLDEALVFWAALTGYWQRSSRRPAPPGAPTVRPYQRRAAQSGVAVLKEIIG